MGGRGSRQAPGQTVPARTSVRDNREGRQTGLGARVGCAWGRAGGAGGVACLMGPCPWCVLAMGGAWRVACDTVSRIGRHGLDTGRVGE